MSSTQLGSFTESQANAVTTEQQNALSSSQLDALISAGAQDKTTASDNSGSRKFIQSPYLAISYCLSEILSQAFTFIAVNVRCPTSQTNQSFQNNDNSISNNIQFTLKLQ